MATTDNDAITAGICAHDATGEQTAEHCFTLALCAFTPAEYAV